MFGLENIVKRAVNSRLGRLFLASAVAAAMYACDGKATPMPTINPSPANTPAPTSTYTPPKPAETPYNTDPNPKPSPTATKAVTSTPEASATPTIASTPTLEAKLFEFSCDGCTDEEAKLYSKIAEGDWNAVKKVYGVENGRMVVSASKKGGVGFDVYINGTGGGSGGYMSDFTIDPSDRGHKHEMAHAINHSLFKTKMMLDLGILDTEPWYNTLDEGSAMYASGEVENSKSGGMDFKKDDGSLTTIVGNQAILDYLISNPTQFWERHNFGGNAGHLTGLVLYWLLEHEGLTPEKHTVALQKLTEYYKDSGTKTNKVMIQSAYESALGKKLDHLFNGWLQPGINRFYDIATATPIPR